LLRLAAALLALIIIAAGSNPQQASAFEPPNERYLNLAWLPWDRLFAQVRDHGELTWQAVDRYGWAGWRDTVARSLDASDDAQSLAHRLNIRIREAQPGEAPDLILYADSPASVSASCTAWATACVFVTNPLPIPAFFNAGSMSQWPYGSAAAVNRHEVFHPLAWACDQYQGGCPPTDQLPVKCLGNPDTLMDCNGAARTVTDYDVVTYAVMYTPGAPAWAVLDLGWRAVFYGPAGLNLLGLPTCTRVAVFYQTLGFPLAFTGVYGPCGPGPVQGVGVSTLATLPQTCIWVSAENMVPVSWGRNLVLAGCTP